MLVLKEFFSLTGLLVLDTMRAALRHFVSVGKRSIAIVIPKKWARALGISAGDRALLLLRRDRSIAVYPQQRTGLPEPVGREGQGEVYTEALAGRIDKRLYMKEVLSLCLAGHRDACTEILGREAGPGAPGRVSVEKTLEVVDKGFRALYSYLCDTDSGEAREIHELEERMDVLYYYSLEKISRELLKSLRREVGTDTIVSLIYKTLLVKTSEDLIDSIDRLVWRVEETGAVSRDIGAFIERLHRIFEETRDCLTSRCSVGRIEDLFRELKKTRETLRREATGYPQSLQPVVSEIENMMRALEDLIEIALIESVRGVLWRNSL